MIIHLDDYTATRPYYQHRLARLISLIGDGGELSVHALMSRSNPGGLVDAGELLGCYVSLHGWNHFVEPAFGYWQARHLLETAESWNCFSRKFKMPWNRMPRLGFLRALRETGWSLVTPYKWQAVVARAVGVTVEWSNPDYLLHPLDLSSNSYQLQKLKEELEQ